MDSLSDNGMKLGKNMRCREWMPQRHLFCKKLCGRGKGKERKNEKEIDHERL